MRSQPRLAHVVLQTAQPQVLRDRYCTDGHVVYAGPGGDLDALLARYEQLSRVGIRPAVPIQHGFTTSLYYRDPDGNHVEMQVENFAAPDEATAYMRGPEFAADPIGPAFDVERMVAARRAGAEPAEVATRAWVLAGSAMPQPLDMLAAAAAAEG